MFILAKLDNTTKDIYGHEIPLDCVSDEIVNVLKVKKSCNLHRVLMSVAECKIPASGEFGYFAWLETTSYVNIQYARKKNPYDSGKQEYGIYVTGFNGNVIKPEEVNDFIVRGILHFWIKMAETSNKEISHLSETIFKK
ncbi:MAG: hypothetical protein NT136_03615 [Candidatus Moranbacteria bacterium]|nr:hypothetical protein [Candidatus Moranbacteria bacterium]